MGAAIARFLRKVFEHFPARKRVKTRRYRINHPAIEMQV